MKLYDKLVRDEIPGIIEDGGKTAVYRTADGDEEFLQYLLEKLGEETEEFRQNPSPEEAADIYEVLQEIARVFDWGSNYIQRVQTDKFKDKGGFNSRYILERVED